jgi:hypothetical protein
MLAARNRRYTSTHVLITYVPPLSLLPSSHPPISHSPPPSPPSSFVLLKFVFICLRNKLQTSSCLSRTRKSISTKVHFQPVAQPPPPQSVVPGFSVRISYPLEHDKELLADVRNYCCKNVRSVIIEYTYHAVGSSHHSGKVR